MQLENDVEENQCPLVTPFTREMGIADILLERFHALRSWDAKVQGPVPFKWPTRLRTNIWNVPYGYETTEPLVPKQYQLQMAHHLARMPRFINGDSVGLGKSLEAIMAACLVKDMTKRLKVILFATKSTTHQWATEIKRFSTLRPQIMVDNYKKQTSYEARFLQLQEFLDNDDADVLICKYSSMIGVCRKVEGQFDEDGNPAFKGRERISREIRRFLEILKPHGKDTLLIFDECQRFKTPASNSRAMVAILSRPCARVWALTATAIKNNLEEFYAIASAIGITPFGYIADFRADYCIYKDVFVGKGRYKSVLQGYKNVAAFKRGIRPFFFGRSQAQVKEKLPVLSTTIHSVELSREQRKLLLEDIPSGKFKLPPKMVKQDDGSVRYKDRDASNAMTMLSVFQLVVNHPGLLDPEDLKAFHSPTLSPKEELLLDMLDGSLYGEPVIVYTKGRQWIDRLEYLTKAGKFTDRKFLRITGAEDEKTREKNKLLFQDPDSGYDLIVINDAGIEGINLQRAGHMICLDMPWSWGSLMQLVGRMLRLASLNLTCCLHVFSAAGTIDEFAVTTLQSKKGVFERILGQSHSVGLLDDGEALDLTSGMEQAGSDQEFFDMMRAHVKDVKMADYLSGDQLRESHVPAKERKVNKEKKPDYDPEEEYGSRW